MRSLMSQVGVHGELVKPLLVAQRQFADAAALPRLHGELPVFDRYFGVDQPCAFLQECQIALIQLRQDLVLRTVDVNIGAEAMVTRDCIDDVIKRDGSTPQSAR